MDNIVACATATNKSKGNEDAFAIVEASYCRGVVLADGIGSHYKADVASSFCVNHVKQILEELSSGQAIRFEQIFQQTQAALVEHVNQLPDLEEYNPDQAFGTTLLCAIELEDDFLFAYVGNGSIWHIQGNFNTFGPNRYLPWNGINLLNPHCIEEGGKSALYRYLSISNASCEPTVIRLSKNKTMGDIIMIASDGIYTYDQVIIGKDGQGKIWISGEKSMSLFYEYMAGFIEREDVQQDDVRLKEMLESYLVKFQELGLMDDDTTLGVIISSISNKGFSNSTKNPRADEESTNQ